MSKPSQCLLWKYFFDIHHNAARRRTLASTKANVLSTICCQVLVETITLCKSFHTRSFVLFWIRHTARIAKSVKIKISILTPYGKCIIVSPRGKKTDICWTVLSMIYLIYHFCWLKVINHRAITDTSAKMLFSKCKLKNIYISISRKAINI